MNKIKNIAIGTLLVFSFKWEWFTHELHFFSSFQRRPSRIRLREHNADRAIKREQTYYG